MRLNESIMERFKITYKRGHGPGGQHKNKVESCVVVTDPETGMTETCQDTRSQAKNRSLAVERLTRRVIVKEESLKAIVRNERRLSCMTLRVRTYNFPRGTVIDHRTGKIANLKSVLNGRLDLLH
jgi:peptide chain release factor 1